MTTFQSAQEQIGSLHVRLMNAQISFDLWEQLYNARTEEITVDAMQNYAGFFTGIEAALFNSFIVLIYSAFEKNHKTVNIHTLLRALDTSLSQDKKLAFHKQVTVTKPTWIKISILRNNVVGHQALNQTPKNMFSKAQVSSAEIRELITRSQQLVAEISSTVFENTLMFNVKSKPHLKTLLADLIRNR